MAGARRIVVAVVSMFVVVLFATTAPALGADVAPVLRSATTTATPIATVDLPDGFGALIVDDAHGHLFASSPGRNVVSVLDLSGDVVATLPNLAGADAMLIVGSQLYVVLDNLGAVEVIDTGNLTKHRVLTTGLVGPRQLASAGGWLWAVTGACGQWNQQWVWIDPHTGAHMSGPLTTPPFYAYCAGIASTPLQPNMLYAYDYTSGYVRFDVSSGTPVIAAHTQAPAGGSAPVFTPDGTHFIAPGGYGNLEHRVRLDDPATRRFGLPRRWRSHRDRNGARRRWHRRDGLRRDLQP